MIPIKDDFGIARMREACAVAASVLHNLKAHVKPGVTTYDLDQLAKTLIAGHGAKSACFGYQLGDRRFPGHACISVNEEVVHGIGSLKRVLCDGDIVALDVVIAFNGYIGDNATTVPVGAIPPRVQELLTVSRQALDLGVAQARVGNRIGDISHAIQHHCEKHGFGIVREMVGHGVGVAMHEEPQIPNYGRKGAGAKIYPGMTLAIEPMVNLGTHKTKTLSDGWTIVTADAAPSAHFEFTVLTREEGPEVLTVPPSGTL
jgi:methionyl aminopeptidase